MLSLKLKGDASALNESRIKSPKQMVDYSDSPKEAKYVLRPSVKETKLWLQF